MAKLSGRRSSRGRSTPIRKVAGATTRTPSDDKPHSVLNHAIAYSPAAAQRARELVIAFLAETLR